VARRTRLLANLDRLFPRARVEVADTGSEVSAPKQSAADKLLAILSRPGLPDILTTHWISRQIGKPWREVWKHILPLADVQRAILDAAMLMRVFLGWLRGERGHCGMVAIPTMEEEDTKRPSRERECWARAL
jgi:hypothetical protein